MRPCFRCIPVFTVKKSTINSNLRMRMNTQLTLDQLRDMNLYGMAYAYEAAIMLPVHEQPEADTLLGKLVKLIDDDAVAEVFVDACLGILRLQKKYETNRLEAACGVALQVPSVSYRLVHNIIEKNRDKAEIVRENQAPILPSHTSIRSKEVYN